jgi:hypothetical protein
VSAPAAAARRPVTSAPVRAVVPALAVQEARRLLLHPLTLLGFAVFAFNAAVTLVDDQGPRSAFETVNLVLTFYPGLLLVLAANLVGSRDHRAGSDEVLGPLPGRAEERLLAQALASLAPALVGLVAVLALHVGYLAGDRYVVSPGIWHVVAGPVTLVGACLFGLMLAVWTRARSLGLIGLVVLVGLCVYLDNQEGAHLFGAAVSWARWGMFPDEWAGVYDGSPMWHVGYLLSLSALALAAAWVRVADRRTPPVVLGVAALVAVMATGLAQLP